MRNKPRRGGSKSPAENQPMPYPSTRRDHDGDKRTSKQSGKASADGSYWIYGVHAAQMAMANPNRRIKRIFSTREQTTHLSREPQHPPIETLEPKEIALTVGADAVHQGVALNVAPLEPPDLFDIFHIESQNASLKQKRPLLLLDQVTDPHNVGAILRSAAAFDAAAVILPKDHSPRETGVMAKAASGALDIVPLVYVTNLAQAIRDIKEAGYWVAGLDGSAKTSLLDAKLSRNTALVMGAEGKGLRRLSAELCDTLIKLPIASQMESLNVSNAAAIALFCLYTA